MPDAVSERMAKQRALLTDTEREILTGERDVKDNYQYSVESRVRKRILGPFKDDVEVLREHYPDLFEEIERAVLAFDGPGGEQVSVAEDSQPTEGEAPSEALGTAPEDDVPATEHTEEEVLAALREFLDDHPPQKDHAKRAVVETVRYLRQHETASTSELQDAVYEFVEDDYSTARTMWNAIDRYFADIPGIEKAGYGEWAYGGDDQLVEAAGREHNDDHE